MKKAMILATTLLATSFAYAEGGFTGETEQGGYTGPGTDITATIAQAKELPNESMVSMTGYIIKSMGDELYLFKAADSQDTIEVEIDSDEWRNVTADETTLLNITGEVDSEWGNTYIEVERLQLAKQ